MAKIDLAFLARQNERIMADNASMRDELRVQTAMITRLDGTVAGLVQEMRATRRILPGPRLASRQVSSRD
jgi:hypothetical protein